MGVTIKNNTDFVVVKERKIHSIDKLLPSTDGSVFSLTRLAMIRAVQIQMGSPALVEHLSTDKPTTIALKEISEGKIVLKGSVVEKKMSKERLVPDTKKSSSELEEE